MPSPVPTAPPTRSVPSGLPDVPPLPAPSAPSPRPGSAAGVRPVVLALAPPVPGPSGRPHAPSLALLGATRLIDRLLMMLEEAGLPAPLVAAPPPVAAELRETLGPRIGVLPADGDRRAVLASVLEVVEDPLLLLHDAERALMPAAVVHAVLAALDDGIDAVAPVIAMTDSVKQIRPEGLRNVDRSRLATVQSPRLLRRATLEAAVGPDAPPAADEVLAALAGGARVRTVHGSHAGFAVLDRLSLWQAQIALGLARDTTPRHATTLRD